MCSAARGSAGQRGGSAGHEGLAFRGELDGRLVFAPDTEMMEDFIRNGSEQSVAQMEREAALNARAGQLSRRSDDGSEDATTSQQRPDDGDAPALEEPETAGQDAGDISDR